MLSSHLRDDLCDSIAELDKHVFHATPSDLYIFSIDNIAEEYVNRQCSTVVTKGTISFQTVVEGWSTAPVTNASQWHMKGFNENYRRMGHWKLTFPMKHARDLGYRWALQIDTDSHIHETLQQNIVEDLDSRGALMAGRALVKDVPTHGLPELTRYFLVAEQIQPQTLFQYCTPPNIDGLYTMSSESFPGIEEPYMAPERGGWDKTVIYSNLVFINTEFWFRDDVQRYLNLVISTGGHFRFRWCDQAVISMIWQIFVPAENFHLFLFDYHHQVSFASGESEASK